jgi:hypothetical protein
MSRYVGCCGVGGGHAAECLKMASNRSRFCPCSYGSLSSSLSAARTCSSHTAWPKSTTSRGRCLSGASGTPHAFVLVRLVRHADHLERHAHVPHSHHRVVRLLVRVLRVQGDREVVLCEHVLFRHVLVSRAKVRHSQQ